MSVTDRIQHAWNALLNKSPTDFVPIYYNTTSRRPDMFRLTKGNDRSIITPIFNRIALDVAALEIRHVMLDEEKRYLEMRTSGLNECLSIEANIDQTPRMIIQDIVMSMLDEGCVALVPVDTDRDPTVSGAYDILSMRTGKIIKWMPSDVTVSVYNEQTGLREEVTLPKKMVAIIENPLHSILNDPNSVMQRLIRKLNLLDVVDEQSSSGKLDLIIQLPYAIKTDTRRQQAIMRRDELQNQLAGSKYGVAYSDGTEKITQLNRPVVNNLMAQVEYLTSMLYSQLGITQSILDGTADEKTMQNYFNRTVEPFVSAIVDEMKRKFLTKTARTQNNSIMFFRDPFKLVPVSMISDIADSFTRNAIVSTNEVRQSIGMKPSREPGADELRNKNLNAPTSPDKKKEDLPNEKVI